MSRFSRSSRFDPGHSQFVTPEEQAEALRAANHRQRQPRPHQRPPVNRASGRKRKQASEAGQQADDQARQHTYSKQSNEWRKRQQKQQIAWSKNRDSNIQHAVHYHAIHSQGIRLLQLGAAELHAATAVARAVVAHPCCYLLLEGDHGPQVENLLLEQLVALKQQQAAPSQQQQQQQQQQDQQVVHVISVRNVACHTLGASFWLPVPTVRCSCCSEEWEVQPASAGFFGSSPSQPFAWFSQQLLDFHTPLSTSGTSMTSMAAALNKANVKEGEGVRVTTRQLSAAWMEWRRVAQGLGPAGMACSLAGDTLGPAALCPACAVVPDDDGDATPANTSAGPSEDTNHAALRCAVGDPHLAVEAKRCGLLPGTVDMRQIGPTGKPIVRVACFDANVKANHYQSAGKASSSSFQQLPAGQFFGPAHKDVWHLQAAGRGLPLSSTGSSGIGNGSSSSPTVNAARASSSSADDADIELDAVVQDSCDAHLTCARQTSQCSSISDVCGVAAGVCPHGQPFKGCALAMPAPERFLYYDLLLAHLLASSDVQLVYLDTGCTYAAHWRLHIPGVAGPVLIKVPWWHARGHGAKCYLKNSGLYLPGSGRRVGENCEQLWAQLRPLLKLTRYMSTDNYVFVLDDALLLIAEDKMSSFATFMTQQERATLKKLELTTAQIQESIETAADLGFSGQQLLAAAVKTMSIAAQGSTPDNESSAERRLRLLAEYVRCNEEESVLRTLQSRRSAVAVVLPGTARQLQSQTEHAKRVSKLLARMAKLMTDLQLHEILPEDSAEYQQGRGVLRDQQLLHLQQQIEREAAALGEITQGRRGMGEACQQTRNEEKKAKRRRMRIRQLVDTICAWQQRDIPGSTITQQLPAHWTEQAIKQLFSGQFPWQQTAGGAGQLPSLLVERFRDACAEQARTLEETQMLCVERQRTVRYFRHLSSLASAAAADRQAAGSDLHDEILEQVPADCDLAVVVSSLIEKVQQWTHLYAQQLLFEEWAQNFDRWRQDAEAGFQRSRI